MSHTYGRGPLTIELRDPIGESWYDRDWAEPEEFDVLRRGRLRPGARVFDVGAHQGVVALMLAREVAPGGQVVAVEPSPHNFAAASRNLELNPHPEVLLIHAAAGAEPGSLTFLDGFDPQVAEPEQSGRASFQVDQLTVDQLAERHGQPDVLFVDVEGYECHVMKGAAAVLQKAPDCFVEVHVGNGLEKFGSVNELVSFFPPDRYDVFVRGWVEKEFKPFEPGHPVLGEQFLLVALAKRVGI